MLILGGIYKKIGFSHRPNFLKVEASLYNSGVADYRFSIWASNSKNFWSYSLLKSGHLLTWLSFMTFNDKRVFKRGGLADLNRVKGHGSIRQDAMAHGYAPDH
jgi:hypothetical protein